MLCFVFIKIAWSQPCGREWIGCVKKNTCLIDKINYIIKYEEKIMNPPTQEEIEQTFIKLQECTICGVVYDENVRTTCPVCNIWEE